MSSSRKRGSRWIPAFAGMTIVLFMAHNLQSIAWAVEDLTSIQAAFLKGEYKTVVSQTQRMIPNASSDQWDQLLYLQGVSAFKLRDLPLAKSSLEQLLKKHPQSRLAAQASTALGQINQQMSMPPASQPATPASQPEESFFTVQVGAFSARINAARMQKELQRKGYEAVISELSGQENTLYRVRVGKFADKLEAEKLSDRLRSDGFPAQVKP